MNKNHPQFPTPPKQEVDVPVSAHNAIYASNQALTAQAQLYGALLVDLRHENDELKSKNMMLEAHLRELQTRLESIPKAGNNGLSSVSNRSDTPES